MSPRIISERDVSMLIKLREKESRDAKAAMIRRSETWAEHVGRLKALKQLRADVRSLINNTAGGKGAA